MYHHDHSLPYMLHCQLLLDRKRKWWLELLQHQLRYSLLVLLSSPIPFNLFRRDSHGAMWNNDNHYLNHDDCSSLQVLVVLALQPSLCGHRHSRYRRVQRLQPV